MAMTITKGEGPVSGESTVVSVTLEFDATDAGPFKVPLGFKPTEVELVFYDSSANSVNLWKWHETMDDAVVSLAAGSFGYMDGIPGVGISVYDDGVGVGVQISGMAVASGDVIHLACRR